MDNKIDLLADALVDVLRFSNSNLSWPELDDVKKDDGVLAEYLYPALETTDFSELSAILQYTQQEAKFEDLGEIFLGIGLVEMKHFAGIRDAVLKLGGELNKPFANTKVHIGETPEEALQLGVIAEVKTIEFYRSVIDKIANAQSQGSVKIITDLLNKIISDEVLHLSILQTELIKRIGESEYKKILSSYIPQIDEYLNTYKDLLK